MGFASRLSGLSRRAIIESLVCDYYILMRHYPNDHWAAPLTSAPLEAAC